MVKDLIVVSESGLVQSTAALVRILTKIVADDNVDDKEMYSKVLVRLQEVIVQGREKCDSKKYLQNEARIKKLMERIIQEANDPATLVLLWNTILEPWMATPFPFINSFADNKDATAGGLLAGFICDGAAKFIRTQEAYMSRATKLLRTKVQEAADAQKEVADAKKAAADAKQEAADAKLALSEEKERSQQLDEKLAIITEFQSKVDMASQEAKDAAAASDRKQK